MHGHVSYDVFLHNISGFLGSYYVFLALINAVAAFLLWQKPQQRTLFRTPGIDVPVTTGFVWLVVSIGFLLIAALAYSGDPRIYQYISVPQVVRSGINRLMNPTIYTLGSLVLLGFFFVLRRIFVQPAVAWAILNLALLLMGMSIRDPNFAAIVTKPDNVPIVAMIFLLRVFTGVGALR